MSDTAPARHAGDCNRHGDHRLSSRFERERHFDGNAAMSHLTIPGRSMQPLCYFLGEKVTQKHFHTAAPLGRQYESAFARSRGDCQRKLMPQPPNTSIFFAQIIIDCFENLWYYLYMCSFRSIHVRRRINNETDKN